MSVKALFCEIHLQNHDATRTMRQVLAGDRGEVYSDEEHERLRGVLQAKLDEARAEPGFVADPYP